MSEIPVNVMSRRRRETRGPSKFIKYGAAAFILGILAIILLALMIDYVDLGYATVIYDPLSHEIVSVVYGPAYFLKMPWQFKKVVWLKVEAVDMFKNPPRDYPAVTALTKDGAEVQVDITVRYQVVQRDDAIKELVRRYPDLMFEENAIVPIVREEVRNIVAKYTLTEIIEKREKVRLEIINATEHRLISDPTLKGCIKIIDVAVRNIDIPSDVKKAIEEKLAAQQEALAAEYRKKKLLIEANATALAKIISAKAEAESRIIAALAEANATLIRAEAQKKAIILIISAYNSTEYALIQQYISALEKVAEKGGLIIIVPQEQGVPVLITPPSGSKG